MGLSHDLISQFVKVTNDRQTEKKETIAYGTAVELDGKKYVRLDGSDMLTPVSSTADAEANERVTVLIKDHTATITGNASSPAARKQSVDDVIDQITEVEILVADKVSTGDLDAERGRIDDLVSENVTITERLTASEANIEKLKTDKVSTKELEAQNARIDDLETNMLTVGAADIKYATIESLEATDGDFRNLESDYASFKNTTTDNLTSVNASITNLDAAYAKIDFANIEEASIRNLFTKSGMIEHLTIKEANTTGALVAVTIKGDLIDANTLKADTLILRGDDGLYHKINLVAGTFTETEAIPDDKIHGSVIAANSITANQIYVTDLSAFGAKIGGFVIDDDSIHSDLKDSVNNLSQGIFLNSDGLMSVGDESNYIKFYEDETDESKKYKLEISADSIKFNVGNDSKTMSDLVESEQQLSNKIDVVQEKTNYIYVGTDDITGKPYIELGDRKSRFKLKITNEEIQFVEDSEVPAYINNQKLMIEKAQVENELRFGGFVWKERSNGNMGLTWEGETS